MNVKARACQFQRRRAQEQTKQLMGTDLFSAGINETSKRRSDQGVRVLEILSPRSLPFPRRRESIFSKLGKHGSPL